MDEITQVKVRFRMSQWMKLIKECQDSGLSVKSWCQQNGTKESSYYYWLKKIRKEACAQLPAVQQEKQVPVEFAKLRVDTGTSGIGTAIIIHLPSATIEVKEGTTQKTMEAVLMSLKVLC